MNGLRQPPPRRSPHAPSTAAKRRPGSAPTAWRQCQRPYSIVEDTATEEIGLGPAPPPRALSGDELLTGLDATVREFWSWVASDLRNNTLRGAIPRT